MINFILKIIHSIVVGLLICSFFAKYIPPSIFVYATFLSLLFSSLYIANLFFSLLWIFRKSFFAVLGIVIIIVFFSSFKHSFGINIDNISSAENPDNIRVMSYNIRSFWGENKNPDNPAKIRRNAANITNIIKDIYPDILCIQEFRYNDVGKMFLEKVKKNTSLKYHVITNKIKFDQHSKISGLVILSKYPIKDAGEIVLPNSLGGNGCIWTELNIDNKKTRIFNFHLASFYLEKQELQYLSSILDENKDWEKYNALISKMKLSFKIREKQAKKIKREMDTFGDDKTLLVGDMNETPHGYVFRLLSEGLQNGFKEKGVWLGYTYHAIFPPFQIDYIMGSKHFTFNDFSIIRKTHSDHYPIVADIILNN